MHESLWLVICTYFYELIPDTILVQNCSKKYMPEEILRQLLGGVDWGFGLMLARRGDKCLPFEVKINKFHLPF